MPMTPDPSSPDYVVCVECPLRDGNDYGTDSGALWARHWLEHIDAEHLVVEIAMTRYRWTSPS